MIYYIHFEATPDATQQAWGQHIADALSKPLVVKQVLPADLEMEVHEEVAMLFISCPLRRSLVQQYLNACRDLRIPYTFLPPTELKPITEVLMPISFLEEEAEKGQYAAAMGRFLQARTTILQANDYGSKAERTVHKITALLDKFSLTYTVQKGQKDSFKINREAAQLTRMPQPDGTTYSLLIVTASRDYGLDDILFGPPERAIVLRSTIPVMLVNPRGDLYALCD